MTGWAATNTLRDNTVTLHYYSAKERHVDGADCPACSVTDEALAALALVETALAAADAWWASKRPIDWTDEQHRAQPFVNCVGPWEQDLAAALRAVRAFPDGEATVGQSPSREGAA